MYCCTTVNQVAVFSAGSPLVVKEVEGRELPSPRWSVQATVVGKILRWSSLARSSGNWGGYDIHDIINSLQLTLLCKETQQSKLAVFKVATQFLEVLH